MSLLAGISGRLAVKKLQKVGYVIVRQRGSHVRLRHPNSSIHKPLTIPLHPELKIGLLHQALQDAGIDIKQFLLL